MSFWDKLTNWKVLAGTLTGVAVAYMYRRHRYRAYKALTSQVQVEVLSPQQRFRRDVEELKHRINLDDLGKKDLKEIFEFLMRETQRTLTQHTLQNKEGSR